MKISRNLILFVISAAAGTAIGLFADRKHPAKGGLLGAATGIAAGSAAAGIYSRVTSRNDVPFYSSSSTQYVNTDTV